MLLLEKVTETLAGRASSYELWPLTLSELPCAVDEDPELPLLDRLLDRPLDDALSAAPSVLLGDEADRRHHAALHLEAWGGMPELLRLDDDERRSSSRPSTAT